MLIFSAISSKEIVINNNENRFSYNTSEINNDYINEQNGNVAKHN